jgi:hypothetical protein
MPPAQTPGVTSIGRILGSTAPVDAQGRTNVGRALGAGVIPVTPDHGSVTYRGHDPRYGYNPHNGRYEPYRHGSTFIGVLLGTAASRPSYHFRYRHYNGDYYYPYYCDTTISVGYYPSPYFYFGYGPVYIPSTRVVVVDRPIILHDYDDGTDDYYLNRSLGQSVDDTLSDIKHAWVDEDIDLVLRHLRSDQDVSVYLKGKYQYSLPSEDYRDLTQDAMTNTTTDSFKWVKVDRQSDDEVQAVAEHQFTDQDGESHKVYASFTLTKIHGAWWIAEVGSSDNIDD